MTEKEETIREKLSVKSQTFKDRQTTLGAEITKARKRCWNKDRK